ncbi:MAG: DUF4340 domain-containing protein, partial [Spirochaetes bacterium]|nr:DUF4340 domain-containing protein [Spirochaetota bacterium]
KEYMQFTRNKTIVILSGLLCVQIIVILLLNLFSTQSIKQRNVEKKLLNKYKSENVISLDFKNNDTRFQIEKNGDQWFVKVDQNNLPANTEKVTNYLKMLAELSQGFIVYTGNDQEKNTNFGFNLENLMALEIKTEKSKYSLQIGNPGPQRMTSYIKYKNENKIREVKSNIASLTSNEYINWAEKQIFHDDIKTNDVISCELKPQFEWNNQLMTILQADTTSDNKTFYLKDVSEAITEVFAVKNVITNLLNLQIDQYKLDDINLNTKPVAGEIKMVLANGKDFRLWFYPTDDTDVGDFILKTDFSNFLYVLNEGKLKNIFKKKEDLIKSQS